MALDAHMIAERLSHIAPFFSGVPDSYLKDLCNALEQALPAGCFATAANEGGAVAMAAGYTLATGRPGGVYMQNSGLGNAINPLLSLNDGLVYGIPVLLVIGWRGEPGTADEPQHKKQGLVTEALLRACDIPYKVLPGDGPGAEAVLAWVDRRLREVDAPVALLVRKAAFSPVTVQRQNDNLLSREQAIGVILDSLQGHDHCIVSTTGMISRELYELRAQRGESHERDFLTVGSMGHASQIALGIALQRPDKTIVCLDGDGAALMHMGGMAAIGASDAGNLVHIVFNNGAHDSVGGQHTCAWQMGFAAVAKECGYIEVRTATTQEALSKMPLVQRKGQKATLIEVCVTQGARADLGRPDSDIVKRKDAFMRKINIKDEG